MLARFKITKDYQALSNMYRRAFPSDTMRDFPSDTCWLIKDEGYKTIGFCSVSTPAHDPTTVFLATSATFVHGAGFHRDSINWRVLWARRNGFKDVVTYTTLDNHRSIANLIRTGFHFYYPQNPWVEGRVHYFIKSLR